MRCGSNWSPRREGGRYVLEPHLAGYGVYAFGTVVGSPKKRGGAPLSKGGGDWSRWERDIRRVLGEQGGDARVTTLFDLYGLPNGFPGLVEHKGIVNTSARCDCLQESLGDHFKDRLHPEDINDGATTAQSKRLLRNVPSYRKTLHGPSALELAGLEVIRDLCPRFEHCVSQLERLNGE